MEIGIVIIGNEILNGRRVDGHLPKMIELLAARGLGLSWVRILGDGSERLVAEFRQTLASGDLVFSFGGIGATPDDRTRQSIAEAAGVDIELHAGAQAEIEAQFGEGAYPNRIWMGHLPIGSELIPNPINRVPGFSFREHHFVPGFPNMAWPMVEWVLDNRYAHLQGQMSESIRCSYQLNGAHESELIPAMQLLVAEFPEIDLSSLPASQHRQQIEFSLSGPPARLQQAASWMELQFEALGIDWQPLQR